MSITTFANLITAPKSTKTFLAEIEPSEQLTDWTLYSGTKITGGQSWHQKIESY